MMEKYSLFSGTAAGGHPFIHLIEPGTRYGLDATAGLDKTASHEHLPQVMELVESLSPQPGRLYILNSAVGAGEWVGFNQRGDWYEERGFLHTPKGWDDIPVWDIDARRQAANWTEEVPGWGKLCWGYPTFMNAGRYLHHANDKPEIARGFVLGAFWDHRMHRLLLVSELIQELCCLHGGSDVYDRIAAGQYPDTSIGVKVPFDECSIGHELARTPQEYCEHLNGTNPKYGRGRILPDGRKVGMYNRYFRAFDDSFVFIGADKTAKVLATFAPAGENAYTQTVYPFRKVVSEKLATMSPGMDNRERVDEEERLRNAVAEVKKKRPEETVEQKLGKLLAGMKLEGPAERKAMAVFSDEARASDSVRKGVMTSQKRKQAKIIAEDAFEKSVGRPLGDFAHLRDRLSGIIDFAESTKTAGHAKWSEMLKEIPAPTPAQMSFIRAHEKRMPPIPDDILGEFASDPFTKLRAAAHLGVVLRPDEFQHCLLHAAGHGEEADSHRAAGRVFAPMPLDPDAASGFSFRGIPPEAVSALRAVLGPLLENRSFAPSAIRIRISRLSPVSEISATPTPDPLLDKVSSLYNTYRTGLLEDPPDWRNVHVGDILDAFTHDEEPKQADSAQELSQFLLCLAYWSPAAIG